MKVKANNSRGCIRAMLVGAGLLTLSAGLALASKGDDSQQQIAVTLNAGETYVIRDLTASSAPAVHVVNNPNALVVNREKPGELELVGAAAGKWKIDVETAAGTKVTYKVNVEATDGSLESRAVARGDSTPEVIASRDASGRPAGSTALDAGSGPVAPTTTASAHVDRDTSAADDRTAATVNPAAPRDSLDFAESPTATTPKATSFAAPAATLMASASSPATGLVHPGTPSSASMAPTTPSAASGSLPGSDVLPPVPNAYSPRSAATSSSMPSTTDVLSPPSAALTTASSSMPAGVMPTGVTASASAPPFAPATTLASATAPAVLLPATTSYPPPSGPTHDPAPVVSSQSVFTPSGRYKNDPPGATPSNSVNGGTHYLPIDVVELSAGSSSIYDFPRRIRRISIADTAVADLQVVNPFQINLVGHKEGFTTLAVWDTNGQYQERQVRVDPFGRQQVMLNVIVSEVNRSKLEEQGINWTVSMPHIGLSLLGLPGNVSTVNQGTQPPAGGGLIPLLLSTNVNYAIAGQNSDIQGLAFFQFLENHDLAKILAEPKLMANSGEKAEFLSGGEIPIVIAQALNTSIVFKQFGVSIIFVPTVVGNDDILLEVKPEVSQPDYAHGVSLFGFTVPAFVTRRAQTFVRLKNNQMLIIAGLLLRTKTSHVTKAPYLGDIPYLGALFKSTSYQEQQSDLVMAVTPQIVAPIPPSGQPWLPTSRPPMTAEEISTQRLPAEDTSRPRF